VGFFGSEEVINSKFATDTRWCITGGKQGERSGSNIELMPRDAGEERSIISEVRGSDSCVELRNLSLYVPHFLF
jgi:hypothetical protein